MCVASRDCNNVVSTSAQPLSSSPEVCQRLERRVSNVISAGCVADELARAKRGRASRGCTDFETVIV